MKQSKFPRIPDSKWVYYLGSPVGVFSNVTLATALFKHFRDKWGNLQEGDLAVVRYCPAVYFYKFIIEDITKSILKVL